MVGAIAAGLGFTVRLLASLLRAAPGVVGPVIAIYGVWLVYRPAGYIVAGLVVWAVDIVASVPPRETPRGDK
jgi:hypothetical protein